MAKLIPQEISQETLSHAEKSAFALFQKAFDDSWTIFHSFALQRENREAKLIDAESDFVFFNKNYGILVMEVKGGIIEFDGKGNCFQNSKPINDPAFHTMLQMFLTY